MAINKFEKPHGPVLSRIIKECDDFDIVIKPAFNKNSYFITIPEQVGNEKAYLGIFIKYSTKRLSPWKFSIYKSEQEELELFEKHCGKAFLILVCGNDGIAALNFDQLKEVLDDDYEDQEWVSAERRLKQEYRIRGSDGTLNRKIPPGLFPAKIKSELQKLKTERGKKFFFF